MVRLVYSVNRLTARPWFDVGRLLDAVVSGDHVEIILVLGEDDAHGAHGDAGGVLVVRGVVVGLGVWCVVLVGLSLPRAGRGIHWIALDGGDRRLCFGRDECINAVVHRGRIAGGDRERRRGGSMGGGSTPPPITSTPSAVVDGDRRATEAALLVVLLMLVMVTGAVWSTSGGWWRFAGCSERPANHRRACWALAWWWCWWGEVGAAGYMRGGIFLAWSRCLHSAYTVKNPEKPTRRDIP